MRHKRFGRRHRFAILGPVDVEHARTAQIETVEQRHVLGVGEHELAVGAPDVGRKAIAAPRRVDTAQHVPAQRRGGHRPQHRGRIAQQCTDMHRARRVDARDERRRLRRGFGQMLTPGPRSIAVHHRDGVVVHS